MITEGQIRTAIAVLREYIDETLRIDDDTLAEELEQAIEDAGNKQLENIVCEIEDESPVTTDKRCLLDDPPLNLG